MSYRALVRRKETGAARELGTRARAGDFTAVSHAYPSTNDLILNQIYRNVSPRTMRLIAESKASERTLISVLLANPTGGNVVSKPA